MPSDESPPPDSNDGRVIISQQIASQRPISATAACIAAIKRRSGAFDTPEERLQRRLSSNLSNGSTPGWHKIYYTYYTSHIAFLKFFLAKTLLELLYGFFSIIILCKNES